MSAFSRLLKIELVDIAETRITGRMSVTEEMANRNGVLHGGVLMSFADTLGGAGAMMILPDCKVTVTIESKTNFLRAVAVGQVILGSAICLHSGRSTSVWQTTITRADGKPAAVVTQTQMILDWEPAGTAG